MADNKELKGLISVTVTIEASPSLFERREERKGDGSEDKVVLPSILEQLLTMLLGAAGGRTVRGPPHTGRQYDVTVGTAPTSRPDQDTGEVRGH